MTLATIDDTGDLTPFLFGPPVVPGLPAPQLRPDETLTLPAFAPPPPARVPTLMLCRARAQEVADELAKADRLRVATISPNVFGAPPGTTDDQALAMYRERPHSSFDSYSTRDMDVFGSGLVVLAAIPGKATLGEPGVHLIYRSEDAAFDSYVQSAEIVVEFCDEAISLIQRDGGCRMSWSG